MAGEIVQFNPATMAAPGGHYSHSISANGFVFVSGQLPIAPDGTKLNEAPFEQQAQQVRAGLRRRAGLRSRQRCSRPGG